MTAARPRVLQAPGRLCILILLVLVMAPVFFMDMNTFARRSAEWIHQGFLAVYVDAESFVSGCF